MQEEINEATDPEKAELEAKYASDISVLEGRIQELQDVIDAAKPDVQSRQEEIRRLTAFLQELQQGKGSSSHFVSQVRDFFSEELRELQRDRQKRQIFSTDQTNTSGELPVVEVLGLALGISEGGTRSQ